MKLGGRRVEEGSGEHTNGNYPYFIFQRDQPISDCQQVTQRGHRRCGGSQSLFFISLHSFICCISFGHSVHYWRFLPSTTETQLKSQSYELCREVEGSIPSLRTSLSPSGRHGSNPGPFLFQTTAVVPLLPH